MSCQRKTSLKTRAWCGCRLELFSAATDRPVINNLGFSTERGDEPYSIPSAQRLRNTTPVPSPRRSQPYSRRVTMPGPFKLPSKAESEAEKVKRVRPTKDRKRASEPPSCPRAVLFFFFFLGGNHHRRLAVARARARWRDWAPRGGPTMMRSCRGLPLMPPLRLPPVSLGKGSKECFVVPTALIISTSSSSFNPDR